MIHDTEMLKFVNQNAQMGIEGINTLMNISNDSQFREALHSQRSEYEDVYKTTDQMIRDRQGKSKEINPITKLSSFVITNAKTLNDKSPQRMAEMMIQGSTMGTIQLTKQLNDYSKHDEEICDVANKLLKTEQNNIKQMKSFL